MKKIFLFLVLLCICIALCIPAGAHGGRTDSSGGHYDRSTGEYHYHHGYPAHNHYDMDGDGNRDCPYNFKNTTKDYYYSTPNTSSQNSSTKKNETNIQGSITSNPENPKDKPEGSIGGLIISFIFLLIIVILDIIICSKVISNNEISYCYSSSDAIRNNDTQRLLLIKQLQTNYDKKQPHTKKQLTEAYSAITKEYENYSESEITYFYEKKRVGEESIVFFNKIKKLLIFNTIILGVIISFPLASIISRIGESIKFWEVFLCWCIIVWFPLMFIYYLIISAKKEKMRKEDLNYLNQIKTLSWNRISDFYKLCSLEELSEIPQGTQMINGIPEDKKNTYYKYVSRTGKTYHCNSVCGRALLQPVHEEVCKRRKLSPCSKCLPGPLNIDSECFSKYKTLTTIEKDLAIKKE